MSPLRRLRLDVLMPRPDPTALRAARVSYQDWQFLHLERHADLGWGSPSGAADAVVAANELALLEDPLVRSVEPGPDTLFVFVCHDWWCRPLELVAELRRKGRALMVLLNTSRRGASSTMSRRTSRRSCTGRAEPTVFDPHSGEKTVDVCSVAVRPRTTRCGSA